ncbi:hypothetical protein WICPIJ_009945 [Wickerhamomyces pijperi]|uniref:Protein kinase domain-containing protein n=1 Tax=Wickerhamomyces pijperi TaxID=599730 RepID=A0A9P8PIK8_WICPI|nr:hypothetical protein WICPIJ_009945 [Wickerhamomyces pijperi]
MPNQARLGSPAPLFTNKFTGRSDGVNNIDNNANNAAKDCNVSQAADGTIQEAIDTIPSAESEAKLRKMSSSTTTGSASQQPDLFKVPSHQASRRSIDQVLPLKLQTTPEPENISTFRIPQSAPLTASSSLNSSTIGSGNLSSGYEATSPVFESITELPTPIVQSNVSSPYKNAQRSPVKTAKFDMYGSLGMRPLPVRSPSFNNPFLNTSTSNSTANMNGLTQHQNYKQHNRIVSEIAPSGVTLDPNASRSGTSNLHHKRIVSTPLSEENEVIVKHQNSGITNNIEREKSNTKLSAHLDSSSTTSAQIIPNDATSSIATQSSSDIVYQGTDLRGHTHLWRHVKQVGKGNFSVVVLGQLIRESTKQGSLQQVAIKIVHLKADPKNRDRVESSLTRELDLLKVMNHPSIITLVALHVLEETYYIFTPYFEGGDLFELASLQRLDFPPILIRRIFAELASAVRYLHHNNIVHRDLKLENILINYTRPEILAMCSRNSNNFPFDKPIITLTDFGLSRAIDPQNPILTTRCGSEDYVPPELLIGLPYDGRQTDSWALGVLLYALMENRLPFDLPPNRSARSGRQVRATHRIARIEWCWVRFADDEQGVTWQSEDWDGAKRIVEGLLVKRDKRWTSAQVCQTEYVRGVFNNDVFLGENDGLRIVDGINIEGDVRREV